MNGTKRIVYIGEIKVRGYCSLNSYMISSMLFLGIKDTILENGTIPM